MLNANAMPFEPGCPALCVSDYDVQAATHGAESDVDDDQYSSSQSEPAQSSAYPGSLMNAKGAVSNSKNRARLSSSGSCTDINESSPRSGLSWYSTDSETGIKISKPIDAITGVTIRTPPGMKQVTERASLRGPTRDVFRASDQASPVVSPQYYAYETPPGHRGFDATSERLSHERNAQCSPPLETEDGTDDGVGTCSYFHSVHPSAKGGLFADMELSTRRAISEGGSPLQSPYVGPLVLSDAAAGLDPYVSGDGVLSSPYHSVVGSVASRTTIPFESGGGQEEFDLDDDEDDDRDEEDEVTSTFASMVGGSEDTALNADDESESAWVFACSEKSMSDAPSMLVSPRLEPSLEYSYDNDNSGVISRSLAGTAQAELTSFRRAIQELVTDQAKEEGENTRELSKLKTKISELETEVQRLNAKIIREHVTVAGVLSILDRYNMIRENRPVEGVDF